MALQSVNIGNYVNDGTGDDLRTAFEKVNSNFTELDLRDAQNNTASNSGSGVGIYKEKIGVDLRFRSLIAGNGISLTQHTSDITINNLYSSISEIKAQDNTVFNATGASIFNIVGGGGVTTTISNNTLTILGGTNLQAETAPKLGANLNLNTHDIVDYNLSLRRLNDEVTNFDFGRINTTPQTFFQWLKYTYTFDLGYFDTPANVNIDMGHIV